MPKAQKGLLIQIWTQNERVVTKQQETSKQQRQQCTFKFWDSLST
jgi:hypothetical protein